MPATIDRTRPAPGIPPSLLAEIDNELTRRGFLAGAGGLAVLGTAGCGSDGALGDAPLPTVLPRKQLDYEQIAALDTDLILGVNSGLTEQEYQTLSGIAPTVAQVRGYAAYGAPWQEIARVVGRALGRSQQAEDLIAPIETRLQRARGQLPAFATSTGVLASSIEGTLYVYAEAPRHGS